MPKLKDIATCLGKRFDALFSQQEAGVVAPVERDWEFTGPARLHVFAVYFNHNNSVNILTNFQRFVRHMHLLGVTLHIVECVLEGADYRVTDEGNPHHVRVAIKYELFRKENLVNVGVANAIRLYGDKVRYLAWIDADVEFMNENIVQDTIDQLNRHQVVQMWSRAIDLDPDDEPIHFKDTKESVVRSFAWCYQEYGINNKPRHGYSTMWHPGYAWAIRRSTFDAMGGLFDISILGAGDHHMAWAFVGHAHMGIHGGTSENYKKRSLDWLYKIKHTVNGDLGVVSGLIVHRWHGRKSDRKYVERWSVLVDNKFEPDHDLIRLPNGVLELTERNPKLRDGIRMYIRQRRDDCNTLD
jgi:hypothetical protein